MAEATTIKGALARGEEKTGQKPSEARAIRLYAQIPPVEKMDASLSTLSNCEKLSLTTNCIEKTANLNDLKTLRILSLGRNNTNNLNELEVNWIEEATKTMPKLKKLDGTPVVKEDEEEDN
uniref:Dynein axonemal light chain 1 n=2 Tax=Bos TaxID=9903 RepID=A0A4W2DMH6_BOBOX